MEIHRPRWRSSLLISSRCRVVFNSPTIQHLPQAVPVENCCPLMIGKHYLAPCHVASPHVTIPVQSAYYCAPLKRRRFCWRLPLYDGVTFKVVGRNRLTVGSVMMIACVRSISRIHPFESCPSRAHKGPGVPVPVLCLLFPCCNRKRQVNAVLEPWMNDHSARIPVGHGQLSLEFDLGKPK